MITPKAHEFCGMQRVKGHCLLLDYIACRNERDKHVGGKARGREVTGKGGLTGYSGAGSIYGTGRKQ